MPTALASTPEVPTVVPGLPSAPRAAPRWLRAVADVRPGEAAVALTLSLTVFLLLTAYYVLKVAREPLILLGGGAEVKAYAAAGQALLLVGVLKVYEGVARRLGRLALLVVVLTFFALDLVLFAAAVGAGLPVGIPFYLWVGIFSVTVLAAFWSFANDVYGPEQGKRLFALLGAGSSVGAVAGAALARALARFVGPAGLMLFAAGLLMVCLGLFALVHRRLGGEKTGAGAERAGAPLGRESGLELLLRDRYLLLIGVLALLRNWVNSTGEYVLDRTLVAAAPELAAAAHVSTTRFISEFKADYFGAVNVLGVLCQFFLASRVIKHLGVGRALLVLPAVALVGNAFMASFPVLALVRGAKVVENSVDYSLQNTAGNALYLVTSRDAKYKAKAFIDAFLMRAGDALGAAAIWAGSHLGWSTAVFARVDLVLCLVWIGVALAIHHRYAVLSGSESPAPLSLPVRRARAVVAREALAA
ncbi:MAG TPA: translocase [Myxococcaceae bacterium]|nr:translocase [Myxococcaceae bacterium]